MLAISGGDTALIVLAAFWGLLVLALCVVLLNTFRVLESTKMTIDTMREETVQLLREVKGSVERANRELDRVDGMLVSAGHIVERAQRLSGLVEQAAASPLVKIISLGAGMKSGFAKVRGRKKGSAASGSRSDSAQERPERSSRAAGPESRPNALRRRPSPAKPRGA